MDRSHLSPLRSLPRFFLNLVEGTTDHYEIPPDEYRKLHDVLRLRPGSEIAVLPNDGTIVRAQFQKKVAIAIAPAEPISDPKVRATLLLALPKPDRLDTALRMATELGVQSILVFPSERTVVRWDEGKLNEKLRRMKAIAREASEVAFRGRIPEIDVRKSLADVLAEFPEALVLSEVESVANTFESAIQGKTDVEMVIGPEGGWAPREVVLIGDRARTFGPLVYRVDTAVAAACALVLAR